jgi:TRAP-type C4-dicarboxylate transport system substrate-binding protein
MDGKSAALRRVNFSASLYSNRGTTNDRGAWQNQAMTGRISMRRMILLASLVGLLCAAPANAQDVVKLKFSHWVIAGHPVSKWIQSWADDLRAKSGGKIDIEVYPSMQLGNAPEHYDMVRRGTADMAWILHGYTSDRFPLTSLFDIPFTVDDAVVASTVVNNPELRAKYFDPEAKGVKNLVLFTNQPTHLYTTKKPVRVPDDLKGLRIRFPGAVTKRFIEEMGGTPVGVPAPAMAESFQKGLIDGTLTDHGAVGITFKLGGLIKYTTELKAYVVTFAFIMNPESYAKLKGPMKELFDKSVMGQGPELGRLMDSLDAPGKKIAMDAGMEVVPIGEGELSLFREAGKRVEKAVLEEREKAGVPAKAAYALLTKLVAETKKK